MAIRFVRDHVQREIRVGDWCEPATMLIGVRAMPKATNYELHSPITVAN